MRDFKSKSMIKRIAHQNPTLVADEMCLRDKKIEELNEQLWETQRIILDLIYYAYKTTTEDMGGLPGDFGPEFNRKFEDYDIWSEREYYDDNILRLIEESEALFKKLVDTK